MFVGYDADFYFSGESIRSEKKGTLADLVSDHLISGGRKIIYLEELELERER